MFSYNRVLNLKQKTVTTGNITLSNWDGTSANGSLGKVDVFKIVSVTSDDNDITSFISLDDGQRDGVYKESTIRYTGSNNLSGDAVVEFQYFTHSVGDYYSVESYDIPYEDIPTYNGKSLSDVLDFRPNESEYNVATLDPNSVIEATVSYYLNRMDIVVVNNMGEFSVIKGIPSLNPVQPETPDNSMLLYTINVPAYTYNISDIGIEYNDNRRYTMRDIGDIEKRIKNLEYYTSLSLLEREANEKQIIDDTGSRFKNGIIVDSFSGHSVGDVSDPGYLCSIDGEEGKLRPSFTEKSTRLVLKEEANNSYGDLASLRYTEEVPFIDQKAVSAHMSVNPYAVASWWGEFKLSPSSDEWKETSQRPDVIIDRRNDAATLRQITNAERAQGTVWGSWRTNWTGGWSRWVRARRRQFGRRGRFGWDSSRSGRQVRDGIRTTFSIENVRTVVNNKVVDTSFVPFIRSRRIYFKGKMFRPDTKVKLFFDGVDISSYATKDTFIEFKNNPDVKTYLGDTSPITNRQELITDENGSIEGYFVIPNNAALKFRTGEREVVITDTKPNDNDATTTASATYSARGVMQHKQRTVVSTRRVRVRRNRVTNTRNIRRARTRWFDPLAQSFMIGEVETGLYATSLDLYFFRKSANVPVQMYIVTTDNGYPSQEVVPFSEVTLNPNEVNISDDASLKTNFKFETPVYLQPGVEYAIVVLSNDEAYRLWLSDVGKTDIRTGKTVLKNPYTGVMFKSQNASTWSADQNKDFMFTFYRAKYDTSQNRELTFNTLGISTTEDTTTNGPLKYSQLSVIAENITLSKTNIDFSISNDGGIAYYPIITTDDIYLNGETDNNNDIVLKATLSSESEYVTPVIDLDRVSLNSVLNDVNSESDVGDSETSFDHGLANARYITHEVKLNNPADRLDVYLNINRPTDTSNVKVYARFKTSEEDIHNIDFDLIEPTSVIPISSTIDEFNEVTFTKDSINEFTSFQVKIVMVSDDHANVPVVEDFRAIATT